MIKYSKPVIKTGYQNQSVNDQALKTSHLQNACCTNRNDCRLHLSSVGFTLSSHFLLSPRSLRKLYKCSPFCASSTTANSKTMHSIFSLHMLHHADALSTPVAIPPCTSLIKPCPHRKYFKLCF